MHLFYIILFGHQYLLIQLLNHLGKCKGNLDTNMVK